MRIDGYEVNNGHVIAVFITDKKRNIKQHKYEPARPHGEWEKVGEMTYKCNRCGWLKKTGLMPYCENCGADLRKRGEKK